MLVTGSKKIFLTDSRYAEQAGAETKGFRITVYDRALEAVTACVRRLGVRTLGFEGGSVSYDTFSKLKRAMPGVRLKSAAMAVTALRRKKDAFERGRMRASARVLDAGFEAARRLIRPGVRELDAASEVEQVFRKGGAEAVAFDIIMASGARGALPHGKASVKRIKKGDLVVVDMGVVVGGYNSDQTRTYCAGRPTGRQRLIYDTVLSAQARAIEAVRPGAKAADVDRAAREHIEKAGYGKFFGHGTGHGVGLDIHEAPAIGPRSTDTLEEGMVVTVEPGIYIPGWGGVRIEDMVLVTKGGREVLTKAPKGLEIL